MLAEFIISHVTLLVKVIMFGVFITYLKAIQIYQRYPRDLKNSGMSQLTLQVYKYRSITYLFSANIIN